MSGILSGSKSYGSETLTVVHHDGGEEGNPSERTVRYNHDPSWKDEVDDFANAITKNQPVTEGASLEALKTMQLVYRIYCADLEWKRRYALSDILPRENS